MSLFEDRIRQFKRNLLINALILAGGNKCKAARMLQIHRNTMTRQLAEVGINVPERGYRRLLDSITPKATEGSAARPGATGAQERAL